MTDSKRARDLEREYREKRARILTSATSWEVKMKEISKLFERYKRLKQEPKE